MPNGERIAERLEELRQYLRDFPNGMLAKAARDEIEYLEQIASDYGL